jgi:hypothetical protein
VGVEQREFSALDRYYDGAGLAYVPPLNEYWYWTRMNDASMAMFKIDPTTTPWKLSRKTMTGNGPKPATKVMRKMVWLPGLNAIMQVDRATRDVYFYKF